MDININTYSIIDDSNEKYNEEKLIDIIIKKYKIKNKKIRLSTRTDYIPELKKLTAYHDKPISTISFFLQSRIYKEMKKDNIKISVTGNGADELFTGYYHHYSLYFNSIKNNEKKNIFYKNWKKYILPIIRNDEYKNIFNKKIKSHFTLLENKYLNFHQKKDKKEKFFCKNLLRNKMLNELLFQTVPLALIDDDLNSMYYSIENRSPFLNKELVELSFKIPSNLFMKNAYSKYLLRLSSKTVLDDRIRLNREKKGFNATFSSVFSFKNKKFRKWFYDQDNKNPIYEFINYNEFLKSFDKNLKKNFADINTQSLFNICSTKAFLEEIKKV